jgi:uroporphyrin-III C-methyltransferase
MSRRDGMMGEEALRAIMGRVPVLAPGHVWLAGAGPGDPGHLTLHAIAGLLQADAIVYDALVDQRVLDLARPAAARVFAGKRGGKPSVDQADIAETTIALARSGKRVLRLKGGDPFVFGRGGEEVLSLASAGIPFRVIPGLTSGLVAMAAALIPATMRGVNQAIIFATGQSADVQPGIDWAALARLRQPIVLYMATRTLGSIAGALIAGGLDLRTPSAVIASAATPEEQIVVSTLGEVAGAVEKAGLAPPAIAVIGEIVAVREQLHGLIPGIKENLEWLLAG